MKITFQTNLIKIKRFKSYFLVYAIDNGQNKLFKNSMQMFKFHCDLRNWYIQIINYHATCSLHVIFPAFTTLRPHAPMPPCPHAPMPPCPHAPMPPCPHPNVSGYFWIRNFSFPDTAPVHTHPANSAANPDIFKSASRVGKNKSATNPITCE